MPPSQLCPCIYCGQQVSASAESCPKCKQRYFKGVMCYWCGNRVPSEAAMGYYWRCAYICKNCLEKHFTWPVDFKCADCAAPLPTWTDKHLHSYAFVGNYHCPHCKLFLQRMCRNHLGYLCIYFYSALQSIVFISLMQRHSIGNM